MLSHRGSHLILLPPRGGQFYYCPSFLTETLCFRRLAQWSGPRFGNYRTRFYQVLFILLQAALLPDFWVQTSELQGPSLGCLPLKNSNQDACNLKNNWWRKDGSNPVSQHFWLNPCVTTAWATKSPGTREHRKQTLDESPFPGLLGQPGLSVGVRAGWPVAAGWVLGMVTAAGAPPNPLHTSQGSRQLKGWGPC